MRAVGSQQHARACPQELVLSVCLAVYLAWEDDAPGGKTDRFVLLGE